MRATTLLLSALSLLTPLASAQTGVGPCHPYPGAAAQDCLELIGNKLRSEDEVPCRGGRATLTLRLCSITTTCVGDTGVSADAAVRRALTTIGSCALNDHGSISGYYTAEDGAKTCYLYPGQ